MGLYCPKARVLVCLKHYLEFYVFKHHSRLVDGVFVMTIVIKD